MDEIVKLFGLVKDIILLLIAITAFKEARKAVTTWIRTQRGKDLYNVGKQLAASANSLGKALRDFRSGTMVADTEAQVAAEEYSSKVQGANQSAANNWGLLQGPRREVARMQDLSAQARLLGVDFEGEVGEFREIVYGLISDNDHLRAVDGSRELRYFSHQEAIARLQGSPADAYGKKIEAAVSAMEAAVRLQVIEAKHGE
jgi:hypothetical protein